MLVKSNEVNFLIRLNLFSNFLNERKQILVFYYEIVQASIIDIKAETSIYILIIYKIISL